MSCGDGNPAPHIFELTHRPDRIEELRRSLIAMKLENTDLRILLYLLHENPHLYMSYLRSTNAERNVFSYSLASTAASPSLSATSSATSTDASLVSSSSSVGPTGYCRAIHTTSPGVTGLVSRSTIFTVPSPSSRASKNTKQETGTSMTPVDVHTRTHVGLTPDPKGNRMSDSMLHKTNYECPTRRCTCTTVIPSKRILGEIAYQLERRILGYIFTRLPNADADDRPRCRFYGYSVCSIRTLIRQEYTNHDGTVDDNTKLDLKSRLRYIMTSLGALGYRLDEHGRFAQVMINRYGILRRGPGIEAFGLEDADTLRRLISLHARDDGVFKNMNILLECLLFLAKNDLNDGKPVF